MQELYEKIIESNPELATELRARIELEKSVKFLDFFREEFNFNNTLDMMLMGTFGFILGSVAKGLDNVEEITKPMLLKLIHKTLIEAAESYKLNIKEQE